MPDILLIVLGTALVNYFAVAGWLGRVPAGTHDQFAASSILALASGLALLLTATVSGMLEHWVLQPLNAGYAYLLLLLATASGTAWLMMRIAGAGWKAWDPRLVAANSIALSLAFRQATEQAGFGAKALVLASLAAAFGLLLLALTELMGRIEQADVPLPFRGIPIALVTTGVIALALLGLTGLLPG